MKLVVDTNIMLKMIDVKSADNWLFELLLDGKYTLCVTTEILEEYAEIAGTYLKQADLVDDIMQLIMNLPELEMVNVSYKWNLIVADKDDNKFADCAIASNADYLITQDKHFKILLNIPFPKVRCIKIEDFKKIVNT